MSKQEQNTKAVLVVHAIILAVTVLNKAYKPLMDKFSKQYIEVKIQRNPRILKAEKEKLIVKLKQEIRKQETPKEEAFSYPIELFNPLSKTVTDYLIEKIQSFQKLEIMSYKQWYQVVTDGIPILIVEEENAFLQENAIENKKENLKQFFSTIVFSIAMTLYAFESITPNQKQIDTAIIEEVDEIFKEITNPITQIEQPLNPIENDFPKKAYVLKFDSILKEKEGTIEEKLNTIFHSNLANYIEIFDYVLGIETLSMEEKINYILNADITSFENKSAFILSIPHLRTYQKVEYILESKYSYKEKISFLLSRKEFTIEQKVWYALTIPDVSFKNIYEDLLKMEDVDQEKIITSCIKADVVPFKTLFNTLLEVGTISKEQFITYVKEYTGSFNEVTLKEKISYILELDSFSESEKMEIFWYFLDEYSLIEKENFVKEYYHITEQDFLKLYLQNTKKITKEQQEIKYLYEKIVEEKEEYILEHYAFTSKEQLNIVIAGVAAEGANSYTDLYWVANVIFNRITHPEYAKKGTNPYMQLIAAGQFSVYETGAYQKYLYPSNSFYATKNKLAKIAFYDMFYLGYDGIRHNYLEFRSWGSTKYSNNYAVTHGNRYGRAMDEKNRIFYEELLNETEEINSNSDLQLTKMK